MAKAPLQSTGHASRPSCVVPRSSRLVRPAPDRSRYDAGFHHGLLAPQPPEAGKLTRAWLAPCIRGRYASRPTTDGHGRACEAPPGSRAIKRFVYAENTAVAARGRCPTMRGGCGIVGIPWSLRSRQSTDLDPCRIRSWRQKANPVRGGLTTSTHRNVTH